MQFLLVSEDLSPSLWIGQRGTREGKTLPGKINFGKKICPIFRGSIFTSVLSLGTEFFPLFSRKVQYHLVIDSKYMPKISSALHTEFPFHPSKPRGDRGQGGLP
jgi:hypothetical protein